MVEPTRSSGSLRGRLATLAGAAGAVTVGAGEVQAVPYTPTAGVVAAQGIPGFSFVDATNVTLGSLRPPASPGNTTWDIDGAGGADFNVRNGSPYASLVGTNGGQNLVRSTGDGSLIRNLAAGSVVNPARTKWSRGYGTLTSSTSVFNYNFFINTPGQFGFRFTNASDTYYGWGSLVIDATTKGQGFEITEAYYQSTPGTAINVGQVPVAVPEPSAMALLGLGAAGVAAWRARRKA